MVAMAEREFVSLDGREGNGNKKEEKKGWGREETKGVMSHFDQSAENEMTRVKPTTFER